MKKCFLLLFAIASLQGCADEIRSSEEEAENSVVYKREREFIFLVSHFNNDGSVSRQDTLILTTSGEVFSKEHGQTRSSWSYSGEKGWKSYSGIEESDTAIWIHPPRTDLYRKLELSPFPMVKYPLEVGNKWTWSLLVGNHYSIKGHAEWADTTNEKFVSNYRITQKAPLSTKLGEISCFEISSFTESNFEQTELKAHFSTDYGFVRLDYQNIDKGRMTFELIQVKSVKPEFSFPFAVNRR